MAKAIHSAVIKSALSYIKENASYIYVCSAFPSNVASASNAQMLASYLCSAGQFTISAAASGAHVTISAINSIPVSVTGSAQHIAVTHNSTASIVLIVTTCTDQALTSGNTVNIPAWSYTINDPT